MDAISRSICVLPSPDHEQDISRKLEVPGGSNIVETHEYMFVLKLEDPTGSVDVVVRGDEAKLFLSQFQSPSDLEVSLEDDGDSGIDAELLANTPLYV